MRNLQFCSSDKRPMTQYPGGWMRPKLTEVHTVSVTSKRSNRFSVINVQIESSFSLMNLVPNNRIIAIVRHVGWL